MCSYFEAVYSIAKIIHKLNGKQFALAFRGATNELELQFASIGAFQITEDVSAAVVIFNGGKLISEENIDLSELNLDSFE